MSGYTVGANSPAYPITWLNTAGDAHDFSTGWAFTMRFGIPGFPATLDKDSGIDGNATAPNIVVTFTAPDLSTLGAGVHPFQLTATKAGETLIMSASLEVQAAIEAEVP